MNLGLKKSWIIFFVVFIPVLFIVIAFTLLSSSSSDTPTHVKKAPDGPLGLITVDINSPQKVPSSKK